MQRLSYGLSYGRKRKLKVKPRASSKHDGRAHSHHSHVTLAPLTTAYKVCISGVFAVLASRFAQQQEQTLVRASVVTLVLRIANVVIMGNPETHSK
jgi:hypothetical protein